MSLNCTDSFSFFLSIFFFVQVFTLSVLYPSFLLFVDLKKHWALLSCPTSLVLRRGAFYTSQGSVEGEGALGFGVG
jgi:hypothetical protein